MKNKITVVVLDSGLDINSRLAKEINFNGGLGIYIDQNEKIHVDNNAIDDIGHGTAVSSLINILCKDVEIIPIKIVHDGILASTETLIAALRYIYNNIECDIINISAGVVSCNKKAELYRCCKELVDRGTIIVSAYDNSDVISYPAVFDCVIGVSGVREKWKTGSYKNVLNNNADYVGINKERYLPWLNTKYELVSGNSFLTPEFVSKVVELMKHGYDNFNDIVKELDKNAFSSIYYNKYYETDFGYTINKAVVFPFNKEMHSLARFKDILDFEITGFYDTKYSGNIGKYLTESEQNETIMNIESLDWNDDFDTVILGHNSIISQATGINYENYIVERCIKYNKNIFSCKDIRTREDIVQSNISLYCPHVDKIKKSHFLKMHVMGCPVLGVVGTGPCQGKFTIQLGIRRELLSRGFRVGQLGTEPTARLFGMDADYPMGHESAVYVKGFDSIIAINQILGNIDKRDPDIIIFGSQSNCVPFQVGGPSDYPIVQHELLLGCQAEAYILCISNDATIDYIKRTISYLEGLYESKVIALAFSPIALGQRWSTVSVKMDLIKPDDIKKHIDELRKEFDIPVLSMNNANFFSDVSDIIVEYFS